ncbi:accessory gene regulator B family protein [Vagococcus fluvialis]|uniref:accessory gene regulator B family protein n=1 Tax=Vagococcus fluvialis TaxID=2738 RepID=UPI0021FAA863|nr:FsrB-like pheromone maturation/export protein [Vagococcus fluvialis]
MINYLVNTVGFLFFDIKKDDTCLEAQWTKYFIENIIMSLLNFFLVLFCSYIFDTFFDTLLLFLIFNFFRPVCGGWHSLYKSYCVIQSIIFYVILPFLLTLINISINHKFILFLFSFYGLLFFIYSPRGTVREPIEKSMYWILKKKSLFRLIQLLLITLFINNNTFSMLSCYAILVQCLLIHPRTKQFFEGKDNKNE